MERYVLRAVVIVALLAAAATTLRSQAPTFDVASVRMNRSGFPGGASGLRPGQFSARNETLRQLIRVAYRLETFRILGGPDWMDADRFDIQARAAMDVPRDQMLLMLQSLLTERFRLAAHKETRDLPIYELVVNRMDGGPPPVDPDRPGIFTALDEQLGLKLEPARGPIEILVIAGAERPVEN